MRDTDADWTRVARENPYWGVLSDEQFRGKELSPERLVEFFASGSLFINNVFGFVRQHIDAKFTPQRSLDFGCGVGRLLLPMARISDEVVGVDVVPEMLEIARHHLEEAGIGNVSLVLGDDELSGVSGQFDFINSFIVMQHIPPHRGMGLIEGMLQRLSVGGVFSLQVTYAKERRFLAHEIGRALYYRRDGNEIFDLVESRYSSPEGAITMFDYDLNEIMLLAAEVAGVPLLVLPTNHDGHMGVHLLGKKVRNAP